MADMRPEILQIEARSYGELLHQLRYWESRGYEPISGTFRYHRLYVVQIQKRADVRPVKLVVTVGKPKFK